MSIISAPETLRLTLDRFNPRDAIQIAHWADSNDELYWLAPSTDPPLTPQKVIEWKKPGGTALVARDDHTAELIAYAELNPMRNQDDHLWLGHVIVNPERRGGTGQAFVRSLLNHAIDRLGATRISLVVFPQNRVAIRCYRRVGFSIIGEEYHSFGTSTLRHKLVRLEIKFPCSTRNAPAKRGLSATWNSLRRNRAALVTDR